MANSRRGFFKALAGLVCVPFVAPKIRWKSKLWTWQPGPLMRLTYTDPRREYARWLGESAKRQQEQMAAAIFNNSFTGHDS